MNEDCRHPSDSILGFAWRVMWFICNNAKCNTRSWVRPLLLPPSDGYSDSVRVQTYCPCFQTLQQYFKRHPQNFRNVGLDMKSDEWLQGLKTFTVGIALLSFDFILLIFIYHDVWCLGSGLSVNLLSKEYMMMMSQQLFMSLCVVYRVIFSSFYFSCILWLHVVSVLFVRHHSATLFLLPYSE